MSKYALMVFRKDCMGCHACEVACKQEHGLGVGPRLVRVLERGADFFPVYCHHCAEAPCGRACPVEAISRTAEGVVLIDEGVCIGCGECIPACPFGAMQFDEERGRAVKCDLCVHRLREGRAPACSTVCGTRCIAWGGSQQLVDRAVSEAVRGRV
jgi:Fe-S-cluster-containing dehydrogenase component